MLLSPDVRHLATCSADHTAKIWAVSIDPSDPNDLEREPERARVAEAVQRGRDVRLDRDAPALVTSVEQVEVVLADGSGVSETWDMHEQQCQRSCRDLHARSAACGEAELVTSARPGRYAREGAAEARDLSPGNS